MEDNVQHTNSQRSLSNDSFNGPRVSFNKDVHVKRIGSRANEFGNIDIPQIKRKLPQSLSEQDLVKEAALVLAQAEQADISRNQYHTSSVPDKKFNSLPSRKKKGKPLNRSVSDASQKKTKKSSILNLFSKRSDSNLSLPPSPSLSEQERKSLSSLGRNGIDSHPSKKNIVGKLVRRSKSDIGYNNATKNLKNLIIDREKINSAPNDENCRLKKKSQLSPIIENCPQEKYFGDLPTDQKSKRIVRSEERYLDESRHPRPSNNIGSHSDLAKSRKGGEFRSLESINLHSSQLPQEKLPLTKGLTVDGMVKKLSMERFSPPPQMNSPGFSYIRPNEPIMYAQVQRDHVDGVSSTTPRKPIHLHEVKYSPKMANISMNNRDSNIKSPFPNYEKENLSRKYHENHIEGSRGRPTDALDLKSRRNYSDEDEGLGLETHKAAFNNNENIREPLIVPRYKQSIVKPEHLQDLSNRRRLLESKIQSRSFRHPTREVPEKIPDDRHKSNLFDHDEEEEDTVAKPVINSMRKRWPQYEEKQRNIRNNSRLNSSELNVDVSEFNRQFSHLRNHEDEIDNKPHGDRYYDYWNDTNYPKVFNEDILSEQNKNNSIKREKYKLQSLDKGDSGIENDLKRDLKISRDRYRINDSVATDKSITDLFLKRERQHTELMHPSKKRYEYIFRERSIDDGSHYDPRLDKYPREMGTLKRQQSIKNEQGSKKVDSKFGSLKKVKDLFLSSAKKKRSVSQGKEQPSIPDGEINTKVTSHNEPSPVRQQPYTIDITTRRRLSTPQTSPLPKRATPQKSSEQTAEPKTGWFMSLDRLSRKKDVQPKPKPIIEKKPLLLAPNRKTQSRSGQPSLRFFGDTDVDSIEANVSKGRTEHNSRKSTFANNKLSKSSYDLDYSIPRRTERMRTSNSLQQLNGSAHHVDADVRDRRSKYFQRDVSASTSENENVPNIKHFPDSTRTKRRQYHSSDHLQQIKQKQQLQQQRETKNSHYDNTKFHDKRRYPLRNGYEAASSELQKPPPIPGPQKPLRSIDRRRAFSVDRDRFHDSSGTEGDSSQSVVYLHATTFGNIPQPNVSSSRKSYSRSRDELNSVSKYRDEHSSNSKYRDELNSNSKYHESPQPQPQARTVSRSVSMSAPWTPRHKRDGYEIEYSQMMQNDQKAFKGTGKTKAKITKN